jgi:hypothetical protein
MGNLHNDQYTFTIAQFFLEWEMFQSKAVEKLEAHIFYIQ